MINKLNWACVVAFCLLFTMPSLAQRSNFKVLVFTSPTRWHDRNLPIAVEQFRKLADKHMLDLTWTQPDGSGGTRDCFTDEFLSNIDVVVFFNSRGDNLTETQMASFKKFIRNGGGFVGIHQSSANNSQELWFQQLVGRSLIYHPEEQTAVMHVIDKTHPSTMHLPDRWIWTDEWYCYTEPFTANLKDLITVDEKTYDTERKFGNDRQTAMGAYHPIAWYQDFDGGRSFYTTLGHMEESYNDPLFIDHIYGGIYWAATGLGIEKE